jgi:ferredoxin
MPSPRRTLPRWLRPLRFHPVFAQARCAVPDRIWSLDMAIKRVWIEEGCIVCNACETTCPEVFNVTEDSCHIRAESRLDGQQNTNLTDRSELKPELIESLADQIEEAAEGCPVEVIKFEKV